MGLTLSPQTRVSIPSPRRHRLLLQGREEEGKRGAVPIVRTGTLLAPWLQVAPVQLGPVPLSRRGQGLSRNQERGTTRLSSRSQLPRAHDPPELTFMPREAGFIGRGCRERAGPTCLVHHRREGGIDGCLAPLHCPDVMVRPILGRRENLKELRRKYCFNSDVLEGEAGWEKGASG